MLKILKKFQKNKILHFTLIAFLINLIFLSFPELTNAVQIDESLRPNNSWFDLNYEQNTPESNIVIILQIIAGALLYFAAPLTVIMIAISGGQMIVSGGSSDGLESGKKRLIWSAVGLGVIILSYSIVKFVLDIIIKSANGTPG